MALTIPRDPSNSRGYAYAVLAAVMLSLTWLAVLARFAARISIKSVGADDYLVLLGQLGMTVFSIAALELHAVVPGRAPTTFDGQKEAVNWLIVHEASFSLGMMFLKLSLGAFFLRLIVPRTQRIVVYCVMATSSIVNFYVFWLGIFACGVHMEQYLFKYLTNQCVSRQVLTGSAFAQGAVNTGSDIIFAIIPFVLLRKSQLPKNVRLYVGGILIFATAGVVASIVRFWYIEKLFVLSTDVYYDLAFLGIVGLAELGVGIIASSVPTLRPLFKSCVGYTSTFNQRSTRKTSVPASAGSSEQIHLSRIGDVEEHASESKHEIVNSTAEAMPRSSDQFYRSTHSEKVDPAAPDAQSTSWPLR